MILWISRKSSWWSSC